jgi:hypothetical protein
MLPSEFAPSTDANAPVSTVEKISDNSFILAFTIFYLFARKELIGVPLIADRLLSAPQFELIVAKIILPICIVLGLGCLYHVSVKKYGWLFFTAPFRMSPEKLRHKLRVLLQFVAVIVGFEVLFLLLYLFH